MPTVLAIPAAIAVNSVPNPDLRTGKYPESDIDKFSAKNLGTLFVETVKTTSLVAARDSTKLYEAWREVIRRYGSYNPGSGRPTSAGALPNIRDTAPVRV